jgi:hypothetical protein
VAWTAVADDDSTSLAHFNVRSQPAIVETTLDELQLTGHYKVRDLWDHKDEAVVDRYVASELPAHGVKLFKLAKA